MDSPSKTISLHLPPVDVVPFAVSMTKAKRDWQDTVDGVVAIRAEAIEAALSVSATFTALQKDLTAFSEGVRQIHQDVQPMYEGAKVIIQFIQSNPSILSIFGTQIEGKKPLSVIDVGRIASTPVLSPSASLQQMPAEIDAIRKNRILEPRVFGMQVNVAVFDSPYLTLLPDGADYLDREIGIQVNGQPRLFFLTEHNTWFRVDVRPQIIRLILLLWNLRINEPQEAFKRTQDIGMALATRTKNPRHASSNACECIADINDLCDTHDVKPILLKRTGKWGLNPFLTHWHERRKGWSVR